MENAIRKVRVFKALGNPVRLEIVEMLTHGELSACEIMQAFPLSQSTISHHMNCLCRSCLVCSRTESKWIYYHLNPLILSDIVQYFVKTDSSFKE